MIVKLIVCLLEKLLAEQDVVIDATDFGFLALDIFTVYIIENSL